MELGAANGSVRLTLDLSPRSKPIRGRLEQEGAEPCPFSGWMELVQLVEERRTGREPAPERRAQPG